MRRRLAILLAVVLVLGAAFGVRQAMRAPARLSDVRDDLDLPASFEASLSGSWGDYDLPDRFAMQLEGGRPVRYRAEHGPFVTLIDVSGREMLVFAPEEGEALRTDVGDALEDMALLTLGAKGSDARIVGRETVDDAECWIVHPSDGSTRFWIGREDGLVRRVEGDLGSLSLAYTRVNAVPAEEFELPEGTTVREMDEAFGEMVEER